MIRDLCSFVVSKICSWVVTVIRDLCSFVFIRGFKNMFVVVSEHEPPTQITLFEFLVRWE